MGWQDSKIIEEEEQPKKPKWMQSAPAESGGEDEFPRTLKTKESESRQQRFQAEPGWMKALIGIGAKSHETLIGPTQMAISYLTGGKEGLDKKRGELKELYRKYEEAAEGDLTAGLGELGADIVYTAAPAGMGSKVGKFRKAPGLIKGALSGAGAGAGSAAVHQLQNVGRGEEVDPVGATLETGLSAVTAGLGSKVAPVAKNIAHKIVQSGIKMSRKMGKLPKSMTPELADRYFKNYSRWSDMWKNIEGPEGRISTQHKALGKRFDDLISKVGRGKQVDLKQATVDARNDLMVAATKGEVDVVNMPKMMQAIDEFEQMTAPLIDRKTGLVKLKVAQNFKRTSLDPRSRYDKPDVLGNVKTEDIPTAKAARKVRRKLTKRMEKELGGFAPLNKEFSQMADIEPYIEQTAERYLANRGVSLGDWAAIATGGAGLISHTVKSYDDEGGGGPGWWAAAYMLPLLVSRAQKSPGAAKLFYEISKAAGSKVAKKGGAAIAQMTRSEIDRRYKVKRAKIDKLFSRYEKTKNKDVKKMIEKNLNKELEAF